MQDHLLENLHLLPYNCNGLYLFLLFFIRISADFFMTCVFCEIAAGTLAAKICYEDREIIAFDDIHPRAPHHKIIIPRKHIATFNDLQDADQKLLTNLLYTAKKIAKELHINDSGYRLLFNCNKDGGQEIYHLHLHLLGGHKLAHIG